MQPNAHHAVGEMLTGLSLAPLTGEMIFWASLLGGAGLIVALIVSIFLARKGRLRRDPRAWNILAKLIYPMLLLALAGGGALVGAAYGAQRFVKDSLQEVVRPALEAAMPGVRQQLHESVGGHLPEEPLTVRTLIEPLVREFYYVPRSEGWFEQSKARVINAWILQSAADALTAHLEKTIAERLEGISKALEGDLSREGVRHTFTAAQIAGFLAEIARNAEVSELDRTVPDVIVNAIYKTVSGHFGAVYKAVGLALLLLLLVITGEGVLYRHWRGRAAVARGATASP